MEPKTVPDVLADAVAAYPDGAAIIEDGKTITYQALQVRAEQASRVLSAEGLGRGDVLVLWAPNSADWIIAAIGAHMIGAILVPLNTRFKTEEAVSLILRTKAKIILATEHFLNADHASALQQDSRLAHTKTFSLDGTGNLSWKALNATLQAPARPVENRARSSDISDYIFTSGTTGQPKGVATTHEQTTANAYAWGAAVGLNDQDSYLIINPFFHTFGYKAGWLAALCYRTTILPMAKFDLKTACELIETNRVSILPGPPTLFEDFLNSPERQGFDISSLRAAVTGAAIVPAELIKSMQSVLGIEHVMTAYGMTETCGVATITNRDDPIELISTTCGKPLPGVDLKIVDNKGQDVGIDTVGEVWLRSKYNFTHYFDDPEATNASYAQDDWLKTGDLGRVNRNDYLTITGRKKDMFICGGFNCYPAEIEHQLTQHEDIDEAAVIGVPDTRLGEVGVAFVVARPGSRFSTDEALNWAKNKIANYKVPRQIMCVESLPRNALGKIEKHKLEALIIADKANDKGHEIAQ